MGVGVTVGLAVGVGVVVAPGQAEKLHPVGLLDEAAQVPVPGSGCTGMSAFPRHSIPPRRSKETFSRSRTLP